MTLTERIASIEDHRRLRDNVIRLDERRERRQVPRWIEAQQQRLVEYGRAGSDLTGYIGPGPDAA